MAMPQDPRKTGSPLDASGLERLALNYAGRYATTRARLRSYLVRKLRERGWDGDETPPVEALVARMATLGYVDDRAFAEARAGGLTRRGYGLRKVTEALRAAGIDEGDSQHARGAAELEKWDSAVVFARRKRLGPFAAHPLDDRKQRDKALSAFLRAGHSFEISRILLDAKPGELPGAPD